MTWRDEARPIIARVIATVGTSDRKRLKEALREAYPWGVRAYHPYRIWCHEIRVQMGEVSWRKHRAKKPVTGCRGQRPLF